MDRPIIVSNLLAPNADYTGLHCFEASHAAAMETQFNNSLTQLAAQLDGAPYPVLSWDIVGGGGGAGWRASFDIGLTAGWGLNTSPPLPLTRFVCREVKHATQIRTVVQAMLAHLPPNAYCWGIKQAASGRDGTYLIAILYSLSGLGSGLMSYAATAYDPSGPFVAETTILAITIPAAVNADPVLARDYAVHYSMLLNDTTGASGVIGRFKANGATLVQSEILQAATEWITFAGVHHQIQDTAGATLLELTADVVGANVTVRGAAIVAHLINAPGAEG